MLEIACFNVDSARIAQDAGAHRIEFCAEREVGGVTPRVEELQEIKREANITIPVNIMIRPRGGDFVYSPEEFDQMKKDVERFKTLADGYVFGVLTKEREVDVERNQELVQLARPKPCTFHRAFDELPRPIEGADAVVSCGFEAMLTSGCAPNAALGARTLTELVHHVGEKIVIVVGGGVRASNVALLKEVTGAKWFHSSAVIDGGHGANPSEVREMLAKLQEPIA